MGPGQQVDRALAFFQLHRNTHKVVFVLNGRNFTFGKNMKYLVSIFFVFGLLQSANAQTPKFASAVEYNDYIVGLQSKIGASMNDMLASLDSGSLAYSNKKLDDFKKTTVDAIAKLRALPGYKGNTRFRDAASQLFEFYKSCAENEFRELVALVLATNPPEDLAQRLSGLQTQVDGKEKKFDAMFQSEQEKFAKDNNFTLSSE